MQNTTYDQKIGREAHAIIPARYNSSRFPGKPLVMLHGRPMFWHVWNRVSQCKHIVSVTLATDDERICAVANELSIPVIMTSPHHQSGTDRVFEAATKLSVPDSSIIVNIQGDEPALNPNCLDSLLSLFSDSTVKVGTLARYISRKIAQSSDIVKVVLSNKGNALYFSRSIIPFDRDQTVSDEKIIAHMGLYAFTFSALREFVSLPMSYHESIEKLEQLRLLDNDIPIRVGITEHLSPGIDREEDIEKVLPLLDKP